MARRYIIAVSVFLALGIVLLLIGFSKDDATGEAFSPSAAYTDKGKGTEERQWVGDRKSMPPGVYTVKTDETIKITMRDGIKLEGRLLLPQGLVGPYATIVQLNGYGNGKAGGPSEEPLMNLAERGYAVLHVSMRGTGASEGEIGLYESYAADGYDVIEWAASQQWSSGEVATVGASLQGITQWLAAKELPPSLKAISPVIACADCYEFLWHPGRMEAGTGRIERTEEFLAAKIHRDYDSWWQDRTVAENQLKEIAEAGIAVLVSGGWNDYISPGNVDAYEHIRSAEGSGHLIMSAGGHSRLSAVMPYEFEDYQALWLDHQLNGEQNSVSSSPPVLIYVQGAEQWRYESAWPIPDAQLEELFFSDQKSGSIFSVNDGSLTEQAPRKPLAFTSYGYSPIKGPFLPTLLSASGRSLANQHKYETKTATWTTGRLSAPTEVTGVVKAKFWAEVNAEDADFVLQLTDVAPDGSSKQVAAGYLNASRAESRTEPEPLIPGEINEYTIEFQPTSYVFQKNHRLRLSIAGGAEMQPEQKSPQGPGKNQSPSAVTIYQDQNHPSSLSLPLIGVPAFDTME
ncbi:putative acyl esterase [Planomicrobium koreense]|uniref:Putative acyl esterase n=1 Tax=Planococcus koreensis TaxID=112331 RepID=A0A7W8CS97_9BACL|nr:CocE/NonD family hydrolase [Planococcus koreensis]MBB5179267.1 putative acyl esterase [Planococcus koreensis]